MENNNEILHMSFMTTIKIKGFNAGIFYILKHWENWEIQIHFLFKLVCDQFLIPNCKKVSSFIYSRIPSRVDFDEQIYSVKKKDDIGKVRSQK